MEEKVERRGRPKGSTKENKKILVRFRCDPKEWEVFMESTDNASKVIQDFISSHNRSYLYKKMMYERHGMYAEEFD